MWLQNTKCAKVRLVKSDASEPLGGIRIGQRAKGSSGHRRRAETQLPYLQTYRRVCELTQREHVVA